MNKTLVLSATLDNLEALMAHGREAATACGMDPRAVQQVELALEEVLVNVITYAYADVDAGTGPSPAIELSCDCDKGRAVTISVADQGTAFNPLDRPDPDTSLPVEKRAVGGLGIFLVKQMMDSVAYRRSRGRNVLTMVKRCPGRSPEPPDI